MEETPVRLSRSIAFGKRQELVDRRAREIRRRIPADLKDLMQFPIGAPVGQLDQLVDGEILEIDEQYSKVGIPGDCIECFRHPQTRLADLSALVVGVESGSVAAMEGYDG